MSRVIHATMEWEDVDPCILVACLKCREAVVVDEAEFAVEVSLSHAIECMSEGIRIIEVLPPMGATLK